jgi:hypothetical protein
VRRETEMPRLVTHSAILAGYALGTMVAFIVTIVVVLHEKAHMSIRLPLPPSPSTRQPSAKSSGRHSTQASARRERRTSASGGNATDT